MFVGIEHGQKPRRERGQKTKAELWLPWRNENTREVLGVGCMLWREVGGVFEGVAENSKERKRRDIGGVRETRKLVKMKSSTSRGSFVRGGAEESLGSSFLHEMLCLILIQFHWLSKNMQAR